MSNPLPSSLLGYLLGALDSKEQQKVDGVLEQNAWAEDQLADLRGQLDRLAPLKNDTAMQECPEGLASKTCDFISQHIG